MKKTLILFFTLTSLAASAQSDYIGILGGRSWTNITGNNITIYEDARARIGISTGIFYEHEFKNHVTLGAELLYNERGFVYDFPLYIPNGPTGRTIPSSFNYNYISLPLKAGYSMGTKLYGFGSIGILPSKLTKSDIVSKDVDVQGNIIGETAYDRTDDVQEFDFGLTVEAGGGYKITRRWNVFTSLLYQRSTTDNTTERYFQPSDIWHYGLTWSLGIKYALKMP